MLSSPLGKDPNRYVTGTQGRSKVIYLWEQGVETLFCLVRMLRVVVDRESLGIFLFVIIQRFGG